jgi:hypothetical protein
MNNSCNVQNVKLSLKSKAMNLFRITQQTSVIASLISTSFLIHSDLASAQQRACVITDEGTTVCGIPTTKPSNESNDTLNQEGFTIKFNGCKRVQSEIVECSFALRNLRDVKRSVTFSAAKLFDNNGNFSDGQDGSFSKGQLTVEIPSGISLRGFTRFKGVPKNSKLVLVELKFKPDDRDEFSSQFRL